MDSILFYIIIFISTISTIILVLEATGFLPLSISKWMTKNKLSTTIQVLKELGFNVNEKKTQINKCLNSGSGKRIEEKLSKITLKKDVEIGKSTNGYIFPEYIDLMGACANERNATDFARELSTLKEKLDETIEFDFIVTSKLGSPILGYEFAKLCEKPLVLHSEEVKFRLLNDKKETPLSKFDFGCINYKKMKIKKALIIDDSTTGGRKVINIIKDLKKFDFEVEHCLVIFAPKGKNAKEKLLKHNVKLHSIIETPISK